MAYEMVMPYHLHMPSYFLETFTEYPYKQDMSFWTVFYIYKNNTKTIKTLSHIA